MRKKWLFLFLLLSSLLPTAAWSQPNYVPRPVAGFTYSAGSWIAAVTSSGATPLGYVPDPVALYCSNDGTGNKGTWVPATSACFGGSGSMTWPAAAGIAVCTGTPCTAWGTSLAAPAGTIVGTSDSQTLTNKIFTAPSITPQSIDCHTACSPTAAQLSNAIVGNCGPTICQTTANVSITGPTLAMGMNFLMRVGSAPGSYYWKYTSTTGNIYLDGGATPVTSIYFATPAIGNGFSCATYYGASGSILMGCVTLAGTPSSTP
jgi:hypothetical protein